MSTPYPTPTSPLYDVAIEWLKRGNDQNLANPGEVVADGATWALWPRSARAPDETVRLGLDAFLDRLRELWDGFIDQFEMDINHPVNVVEGKDAVVIQIVGGGVLKSGKKYQYDCLFIFRFNEQQKIVSVDEFLDPVALMQAFEGEVAPKYGSDGRVTNVEEAKQARMKKA